MHAYERIHASISKCCSHALLLIVVYVNTGILLIITVFCFLSFLFMYKTYHLNRHIQAKCFLCARFYPYRRSGILVLMS